MNCCRVCWRTRAGARSWLRADLCPDCASIALAIASWFAEAEQPSVMRLLPEINHCLNEAGAPLYGSPGYRRRVSPSLSSPAQATREHKPGAGGSPCFLPAVASRRLPAS